MAKNILFSKIKTSDAAKYNIPFVAVPKYNKDIEIFQKIKGDFKAKISQPRNLEFHRKLFAIAETCVDNGIFDNLHLKMSEQTGLQIDELYIIAKRRELNNDPYCLIWLCKWMFLPLKEEVYPDGTRLLTVPSINFEEMDNIIFTDFYNNSVDFFAYCLEVTKERLELNSSR